MQLFSRKAKADILFYILVCLQVLATVGSQDKKKILLKAFPELREEHILDSHSTQFEFKVQRLTRGRGVDVVLHPVAEEKFQSSVRVLAQYGRLLQIGKADMANNSSLGN